MQNFDLLDFLSHNYVSLGTVANQNMWRSYCYGDPNIRNIWWWHLQEEANMPFGDTTYYFTKNDRYRVSFWLVMYDTLQTLITFYLYIEDLKLSKVKVYVSTLSFLGDVTTTKFLSPSKNFHNLSIEILDNDNNVLHTYSWNDGITLLGGRQRVVHDVTNIDIWKSLLIFDKNEALLYLYDGQFLHIDKEMIIHFLAFSEQSIAISGMEYTTSEVTSMNESSRLYNGLNNTHIYINNWLNRISSIKVTKDSTSRLFSASSSNGYIVRPLSNDFPWFILFVFRPTPVSGNAPTNYNILLPIGQNYNGYHAPITRWKLNNGYSLSIECGGISTCIFIQNTIIYTRDQKYFWDFSIPDTFVLGLYVTPDSNLSSNTWTSWGHINVINSNTRYRPPSSATYYSCNIPISSLFYYYGDNTENLIWLFRYDSDPNLRTAYVIYSQNMNQYAQIISDAYGIFNLYLLGIYDRMYESNEAEDTHLTLNSYLDPNSYHTHLNQFFIFNTLAHTAPQVINGSWNYMHYLRFVLDDYTSSNLRIPIAIVEGDIKRDNIIKYRQISIDKMSTSQRYPIAQLGSLSKAQMSDVVLDGYIASLNDDTGKKEDSSFGTLIPYYDLKEAQIQEPHPEWYFRIHIHAGTWYYIFNNLMSDNNNQMKTYRIQHNDGNLRIVLDVGLYFEILTETASGNNKKYTILYADIFPSVYWCYGSEAYEFLNVNVEWIQCRYSMPGSSMVRFRPNNNIVVIGRPREF